MWVRLRVALGVVVLGVIFLVVTACAPLTAVGNLLSQQRQVPEVGSSLPDKHLPLTGISDDLLSFFAQKIDWRDCGGGFECVKVTVPINWAEPSGSITEIALVRTRARGERLGSLFINPGGPGASGVDFVKNSAQQFLSSALFNSYDVVGFDPRGVGASKRISCGSDQSVKDLTFRIVSGIRGSDEWLKNYGAAVAKLASSCTGDLVDHVDTISTAKDLDMLRFLVGDQKLNYFGFSYGTLIGEMYAQQFPTHIGRMVLDGAIDPSKSSFAITRDQAVAFERALRSYFEWCAEFSDCGFHSGVAAEMAEVRALLSSFEAKPIKAKDNRMVGADVLFTALIYPLYSKDSWLILESVINAARLGDANKLLEIADIYYSGGSGEFDANMTLANIAISCLDYPYQKDIAVLRSQAAELAAVAPTFGPYVAYSDLICTNWAALSTRIPTKLTAPGVAPILVLGATGDPATPYADVQAVVGQLPGAKLVTYNGEGHLAYASGDKCVLDAVDAFLTKGAMPSANVSCGTNSNKLISQRSLQR